MVTADHEAWYRELLAREPFELSADVPQTLAGRTILVTGGAGSIGSQLVHRLGDGISAKVIVFDNAEDRLYRIHRTIQNDRSRSAELVLGDINSVEDLQWVFDRYHPDIVFHAAAHKYIDFLEGQVLAAVRTNVFGTRNVLAASAGGGVESLVVLSSDKATNPTSVLGATKRAAELMTISSSRDGICAIRLCNVLGSDGSLIPLVLEQIGSGRVTLTDNRAERYFVSPNEAVDLLLSAAVEKEHGVVIPKKASRLNIRALVEHVLKSRSATPEIEVVGLRPGEKLTEELYSESEKISSAKSEGLLSVHGNVKLSSLPAQLDELEDAYSRRDERAVIEGLMSIVPEYKQSVALGNSVTK